MWYGIMFAALLSVDSFGVGLACGVRKIKIPVRARLLIALISGVFAGGGYLLGKCAEIILQESIASISGGILLITAGVVLLIRAISETEADGDRDGSGEISHSEALLLGFALSADMLSAGTGLTAGGKISVVFPIAAGICQFVMLSCGIFAGKLCKKMLRQKTGRLLQLLSPMVLLVIGIIKLAECLSF